MSDESRTTSRVLIVIVSCLVGVWFGQLTLWHTDLWGHLSYGRLMVEQGQIPATEPFIPSARDTPLVATAWLAQIAGFLTFDRLGAAGLQAAFGICVGVSFLFLVLACQRQTRSVTWALICGLLFLGIASEQLRIIRPQAIGLVLFCYLLFELSAKRITRRAIVSVGIAFVLWANTHPSYPVGLLLLSLALIDRYRAETMGGGRVATVLLTAVIATFFNPYGPLVYQTVLGFASSPNLTDIVEWQPIKLSTRQGMRAMAAGIVILIGWCVSRRRPDLAVTLLLGCFTVMLFRYSRFVLWWSVIACYALANFDTVARRFEPLDKVLNRMRFSRNTLLALLTACVVARLSNPGPFQNKQPPRRPGPRTPITATDAVHAADLPIESRIFTSYEFSDYVLWRTWPEHGVFLTSHVHLLPPPEWQRYLTITRLKDGWRQKFEQLNASAVVLDIRRHSQFAHALEQSGNWQLLSTDEVAITLIRKPIIIEHSE